MYIFIPKEIYNQYKSQIKIYLYGTGGPMSFYWLNEDEQDRYGKVSIFISIKPHHFEKVMENFFKALGKNIIEDVGMVDVNNLFKK
jgi:hypothetical protein